MIPPALWRSCVLFFWLLLSLLLLFGERQNWHVVSAFKKNIQSSIYTLQMEIGHSIHWGKSYFSSWENHANMIKELDILRQEKLLYNQVKWQLQEKERQISLYQQLLELNLSTKFRYKTVRVYADTRNFFSKTIVIKQGRENGIREGAAVIGIYGIVGHVIDVFPHESRILLVQDFNSMIPVIVKGSYFRGIVRGNGNSEAYIDFLPFDQDLKDGDVVVTSDFSKKWPVGVPVGVIRVKDKNMISVVFFEKERSLEYVRVAIPKSDENND